MIRLFALIKTFANTICFVSKQKLNFSKTFLKSWVDTVLLVCYILACFAKYATESSSPINTTLDNRFV